MKKFFHLLNRLLSIIYKVFPFFVGMYCYYPIFVEQGHPFPFLDSIYSSVKLYSGAIESGVTPAPCFSLPVSWRWQPPSIS